MHQIIKRQLKQHHIFVSSFVTALCCVLAYIGAFVLRFDFGRLPEFDQEGMRAGLPVALAIRLTFLTFYQSHRGLYRYVGLHDVIQLFKAVTWGSICLFSLWSLLLNKTYFMPRSIYLLEWMLCLGLLIGLRIMVRIYRNKYKNADRITRDAICERVLIVGADNAAETILRIIDFRFQGNDEVVGFVDLDSTKRGRRIHGIPVLGHVNRIADMAEEYRVHTIVFAVTEQKNGFFEEIIRQCDGLHLKFNTISVLKETQDGEVKIDKIRSLNIEDLLGRKPVELDYKLVKEQLQGKTVLVTGAGGSIGSELCRQVAQMKPGCLILFDVGETPLFEIERELRHDYPNLHLKACIADIRHDPTTERIFALHRPHYVYHAAAYKHVPLMEAHPEEAVINNVRGTRLLAQAAKRHGCVRFVMISSDKAVRPTNIMGATKQLCEMVIQAMNGEHTTFAAVRFGNVLGSNGSVIPIFRKQIESGGPLTVTHPEMTRYFMTIPEAVSLVLQCGSIAKPADIFVLDMGTPIKIIDLAKNMIQLYGLKLGTDIDIEITGLRPGEKMHEELVAYGEKLKKTSIPKVNVLKRDKMDGCYDCGVLFSKIHQLESICYTRHMETARAFIWYLIEFNLKAKEPGSCLIRGKCVHTVEKEWSALLSKLPSCYSLPKCKRVLVISNEKMESSIRKCLGYAGYEVEFHNSIGGILSSLKKEHNYAAILCDYFHLCEMFERLSDGLRKIGFDTPVIILEQKDYRVSDGFMEQEDFELPRLCVPFHPSKFKKILHKSAETEISRYEFNEERSQTNTKRLEFVPNH